MSKRPISEPMLDALSQLWEHGVLERKPGGFWTYSGCPQVAGQWPPVPAWYAGAVTIMALHARGLVLLQGFPERAAEITDAGHAAYVAYVASKGSR